MTPALRAALLMTVASSLIAASTFAAKMAQAVGDLHPIQVSQGRFLFGALGLVVVTLVLRPKLTRPAWSLHIPRILCGWGGVTLLFAAAGLIPLPDATALSFLNPVFAMLFAIVLLGERVGPWRWGAAAVAFAGAVILLRPTGAVELGALLALASAVVLGLEISFIKRLTGRERPLQIILIANLVGLCIATTVAVPVLQWPTGVEWAWLSAVGFAMVAAQGCFTTSLKLAESSFVVPFSYAALLFVTLYDFIGFGLVPDAVSWIGMALMAAAGITLAIREGRPRVRTSA
ncbi:MAG: DMT family transporter [Shimia sp.]